jgi:hypothetical protein
MDELKLQLKAATWQQAFIESLRLGNKAVTAMANANEAVEAFSKSVFGAQ